MAGYNNQWKLVRADWEYFRARAEDGASFTIADFLTGTGRKMTDQSVRTYISKHYEDFLEKTAAGGWKVIRDFLNITFDDFTPMFRQKEGVLTFYDRSLHRDFLVFEFFLPLTHERRLRAALDKLFYEDTVRERLRGIGAARLSRHLRRNEGEQDDAYIERLVQLVGDTFGGYSISHVSGRFRASIEGILSLSDSATRIAAGGQYLIDETTAVVRFIVPCGRGAKQDPDDFDEAEVVNQPEDLQLFGDVEMSAAELRALFHLVFVEAIVRQVRGEHEIWLIESGLRRRLWRFVARQV